VKWGGGSILLACDMDLFKEIVGIWLVGKAHNGDGYIEI
jgi:hypothetical protein